MAYEAEAPDKKPKVKKARSKEDDAAICKQALERYNRWNERERENTDEAYTDLKFRAGEQWDKTALDARKGRPTLTVNRIPQFIRQVTGDMRQKKPGIKVVPVDSRGDKDTAETMAGMIRYIENRSLASNIYMSGAESQVTCGIGHWMVTKEYADGTTYNQELRIIGIDDQVAVACDPDAKLPMKDDAKWWIIPVDVSREAFKEEYPDASVEDFDDVTTASADGWFDQDFVRIAQYWVKKPAKRLLALMPDGGVSDLTDMDEAEREEIGKTAKRVEERDSFKVCRYLLTACHVLEETDWPGMNIPIVPVIGEEIKIGKRTVRHGLTRFARDPQRMVNYYSSAEAEVVALQPKSPWIGTEKNFQRFQAMWETANTEAHSALIYTPDTANGNIPPQRVQPAVSSQGISEGLDRAVNDMKGVIGIYDAGLGSKSNETSGKAILARQREGDVGTYVYTDNWSLSIMRTGAILIDLIPHVYDTERMIRIMGEDGKVDLKWINRPVGAQEIDPATGEPKDEQTIENDVTVGAYDVALESGPSFTTKREEAKESMREFIQSAPETAPIIMDLFAKSQDWPLGDEIGKRFEVMAPPPIQQLLAKQKQEAGEEETPDPQQAQAKQKQEQMEQMQQQAAMLELQNKQLANQKIQAETDKIAGEAQGRPDPVAMMKARAEEQRMMLDARKADLDYQTAAREADMKERIAAVELEIKLADLAIKKQGLMLDTASAAMDLNQQQQGMTQEAERHAQTLVQGQQSHTAGLVQGMENHVNKMTQGAESHAAKVKQMNTKPNGAGAEA
jgi:hypothetical protein